MLIYANEQILLALLLHWTSLRVSIKWGEQIWYLNMEYIEEKTLPVNCYHLSSGCMDPYTIVVSGTHLEYLANADTSLFWVLSLWCFLCELKLILKLKLNS